MALVKVLDDLERLELVLGGKAVAALCLHGRGAEAQHLVERLLRLAGKLLLAGLARGVRRGLDAAACVLNIKIARAVQLEPQLVLPPATENEVRVRVHKAGRDEMALRIDDLRALTGGNRAGADGGDDAVLDEHPRILQEFDFTLLLAATGASALGRRQQADVSDQ